MAESQARVRRSRRFACRRCASFIPKGFRRGVFQARGTRSNAKSPAARQSKYNAVVRALRFYERRQRLEAVVAPRFTSYYRRGSVRFEARAVRAMKYGGEKGGVSARSARLRSFSPRSLYLCIDIHPFSCYNSVALCVSGSSASLYEREKEQGNLLLFFSALGATRFLLWRESEAPHARLLRALRTHSTSCEAATNLALPCEAPRARYQ